MKGLQRVCGQSTLPVLAMLSFKLQKETNIPLETYCAQIRTVLPEFFPDIKKEENGLPVIFADGSGNGWAAAVFGEEVFVMRTPFAGHNNAVELSAVLLALYVAERKGMDRFTLVSDSRNAKGWLLDGWKINVPEIRQLVEKVTNMGGPRKIIRWEWIKGHAGSAGNTKCDQACRQAAGGDFTGLIEIPFAPDLGSV